MLLHPNERMAASGNVPASGGSAKEVAKHQVRITAGVYNAPQNCFCPTLSDRFSLGKLRCHEVKNPFYHLQPEEKKDIDSVLINGQELPFFHLISSFLKTYVYYVFIFFPSFFFFICLRLLIFFNLDISKFLF